MNTAYTRLAFAIIALTSSVMVYADSWDITQTVTVNSHTTMQQSNGRNSFQTMNAVNLGNASNTLSSAQQSMSTNGNDLILQQSNSTSSTQAINYIRAAEVTNASQVVNGAGNITLRQSGGSGNVQAVNMTSANTVDDLSQSVSSEAVNFIGSGTNNIQAGNYLQTTNASSLAGVISQNFSVQNPAGVSYQQAGTDNIQAGNLLIRNPGFTGTIEQTFTVNSVTVNPTSSIDGNNSIMAANYTR